MTQRAQPQTIPLFIYLVMFRDQRGSSRDWARTGSDEFWSRTPDTGRRKGTHLLMRPAEAGTHMALAMGEDRANNHALAALGPTRVQDQQSTAVGQLSTSGTLFAP